MSEEKSGLDFGLGLLAGIVGGLVAGVLYSPTKGEENRAKLKKTVCDLWEKFSPDVLEAKKQALESVDLLKYKLEKQYKKINNSLKSNKMLKAKELESCTDFDFN